jgi:hypothetical protein
MKTKVIQARHLQLGDEIVDGGDGVRRTAHKINEIYVSRTEVFVRVRKGDRNFDPRDLKPKDPIRIRTDKEAP